jgi:transcription elongation factor Elf1
MYRQQSATDPMKSAECPKCNSKRLMLKGGKLSCTNCGEIIGTTFNKYGAKRTVFNGKLYDSKFEASVASELETRKRAKDIRDYETQYRVECWAYREDGEKAFVVKHKVDFRIHHNDGSFELYEAKGIETADYKFRRKCLEELWLPLHKDHIYTVIKQNRGK